MAQRVQRREAANPFSLDPAAELPLGVQLGWRLRALIQTGRLPAGERLPSFRRLAEWAGVNVNTVRAVYSDLEQQALVVSRHGSGTFVAEGVVAAPQLEEIAVNALRRAREAGASPDELAVVVAACASMPGGIEDAGVAAPPGDLPDPAEESEVLEVRHELRRQIARLEAELASYTRDLPDDLPTARLSAEAHVAGVEELERTRDTLIARLSEAQGAAEHRAREAGRARAHRHGIVESPDRSGAAGHGPLSQAIQWWRAKS